MSSIDTMQAGDTAAHVSDEGQLVVFKLAEEEFGVDIRSVKEIVRLPEITPIPRSPGYVAGICNLRGSVLPVINTRVRFAMDTQEATDHTRLLVVETGGVSTGLIVDDMREVMRMTDSLVEPPPAVCKGVDKEFLDGVVKMDAGKRLILTLNLHELVYMDVRSAETAERARGAGACAETSGGRRETIEEEQLVSFKVADEEYAFDIARVREILRVTEVTAVPNVPEYVKGVFTIRNQLLPILDLRCLLGISSLISERNTIIDEAVEEHRSWLEMLKHAMESGVRFAGATEARETRFGKWLEEYNTPNVEMDVILKRLKRSRADLFGAAQQAVELRSTSGERAVSHFEREVQPLFNTVVDALAGLRSAIGAHVSEDQRVMVVEADGMNIGYLVDSVNEVVRIPRSIIDETPAIASSSRKELKGVARLDEGERLIMIMDESTLVSHQTSRILSEIQADADSDRNDQAAQKRSLAQQSLDEEQLVTFSINKEEYGIRIMQVQEINRITEITSVPRAPHFVDGVTNLRGNVIPVINIRELFDLENKEVDDRTRIIIVDIGGNKTGLRVDQVNEVLRLAKQDIEKTPSIVTSSEANRYMQGVCKMDGGKRMVVLLDVEKILDEKELKSLSAIAEKPEADEGHTVNSQTAQEKKKAGKRKAAH